MVERLEVRMLARVAEG